MTIEQLAEQYADAHAIIHTRDVYTEIQEAYIAGYNKGRVDESINAVEQMNSKIKELHSVLTHKGYAVIQWHKVADELPPNNWRGLIYTDNFKRTEIIIGSYRNDNGNEWYLNGYITTEPPIAWAEIPTFTE